MSANGRAWLSGRTRPSTNAELWFGPKREGPFKEEVKPDRAFALHHLDYSWAAHTTPIGRVSPNGKP